MRGKLFVVVKAAVTIGLLAWLATRVHLAPMADRLGGISFAFTLAAVLVMFLQLGLAAWRWALVARAIDAALPVYDIIRLSAIGQFFNQTLPSAIGGDVVRAWLASRLGLSVGRAAAGVIADRAVALIVLVALIGVTLPAFFSKIHNPAVRTVFVLVVATYLPMMAALVLSGRWLNAFLGRWRVTRPLGMLIADLRRTLIGARESAAIIALSIAVHLLVASVVFLVARALGIAVGLVDCVVLVPPIILLTMLPVSIAGWGIREGAMVVGFGMIGMPAADALALSVAFGAINILSGLPGGIWWFAAGRARPARSQTGV
jgi:uncharacterized membrane protein YbhN (UPF0104 family)